MLKIMVIKQVLGYDHVVKQFQGYILKNNEIGSFVTFSQELHM